MFGMLKSLFTDNEKQARNNTVLRFLSVLDVNQLAVLKLATRYPLNFQGVLFDALAADYLNYISLLDVIGAPNLSEYAVLISAEILKRGGI